MRAYNPSLRDDLRHRLWLLKEQTGQPMTYHLNRALELYLNEQERINSEDEIGLEDQQTAGKTTKLCYNRCEEATKQQE